MTDKHDWAPRMPEVKFNKSGYEIRADVLSMAKEMVGQEFHYKYMGWEASVERDKDGKVVTKVGMPEFPGLDKVLETAEKMYGFITAGTPKR